MGSDVAPEKRPVLLALWHGLGEIYRTRLKDYPAAMAAFEVAADLDPESAERRKILAELYRLSGPATYGKAIAAHRALVQRAASPAEMAPDLKTMLRLFVEMGALDEAHAAASVLVGSGPGRSRRGDAVPAVPAARRDPRARPADRGAVAAAPLSPRGGSRAVADPRHAERRGRDRAREAAQGHRPQAQAPAQRAHRPDGRLQGARVRRRRCSGRSRPTSTWCPNQRATSTSSTCAARSRACRRWSSDGSCSRWSRTSSWRSSSAGRWPRSVPITCCAGPTSSRRWPSWRSRCAPRSGWSIRSGRSRRRSPPRSSNTPAT